ncbi:hypothetical protein DVA86_18855 [Streptomyces armeniacus]|uniref:Uncharacterized protein n=1 Tax=Streptomyces armeniacus TaxID=83291 RepID=A0A345XRY4_9ACTN|nr:hypothetical protein [Streptomyces armeniacus]AXK34400.1 hypothetical protein DVA86_18855 [Streptomyces armeniacus]
MGALAIVLSTLTATVLMCLSGTAGQFAPAPGPAMSAAAKPMSMAVSTMQPVQAAVPYDGSRTAQEIGHGEGASICEACVREDAGGHCGGHVPDAVRSAVPPGGTGCPGVVADTAGGARVLDSGGSADVGPPGAVAAARPPDLHLLQLLRV